jgi:hypothetical protein
MYRELAKIEDLTEKLDRDQALAARFAEDPVAVAGEAGIPIATTYSIDYATLARGGEEAATPAAGAGSAFYLTGVGIEFVLARSLAQNLQPHEVEKLVDDALEGLPPSDREKVKPYTHDLKRWMERGFIIWRIVGGKCRRQYVTTFTVWFVTAWTPPVCRLS